MRSARWAIVSAALTLVVIPLFALGIAWGYEQWLMFRSERALSELADEAMRSEDFTALAQRGGVQLYRLDSSGVVLTHPDTRELAVHPSTLAELQRFTDLFGAPAPPDPWERFGREAGAIATRREVVRALAGSRSFNAREATTGDAVLFTYAAPHPAGGAIYVETVSQRGIRRLLGLKSELLKLVLYQLLAGALFATLLGRWLVRPLERLTEGAARYPRGAIADEALLGRRDEVGQLARSFAALASSLEERRSATVDLAADMAHELKNPLATIAASAELFGSARELSKEKRELVETQVSAAVFRLRHTTDELLSMVRFEATLPSLAREELPYAELLEQVILEYRSDPRFIHFTFELSVGEDVGKVRLSASAWKRLLRNLIDNALVQPADTRRIQVRAVREGPQVFTTVRDFGPGVSRGNREKIFRRFFTNRPEGTPAGTGLGLSIVQAVALAHGGSVVLVETPDGPGATFRLTLPA